MGSINIDNTGTGADVTLSSDGTDLLLDGTAVGGGGADLYAANLDTGYGSDPSATGSNAVAIGRTAVASGNTSFAAGFSADATSTDSLALGRDANANGNETTAIGLGAKSVGTRSFAAGKSYASSTDSFAAAITDNTSAYGAAGSDSIAMGYRSKTSNSSNVAIGRTANTSNNYSTVIGGSANNATGARSAVLGGQANDATGSYSVVAGGYNSTASGAYSVVAGGYVNTASGQDTFASGRYALAEQYGKLARASGRFSANGDAQGGQFILRADTTDATATVLTADNSTAGSTNQIVAASDTCITFDGTITAMQNGAQAYASWKIEGLLVNDGGTTTLANSATTVISNADGWGMALSADTGNNALAITVTGEASHNIRWVANIRTTEVTYA